MTVKESIESLKSTANNKEDYYDDWKIKDYYDNMRSEDDLEPSYDPFNDPELMD